MSFAPIGSRTQKVFWWFAWSTFAVWGTALFRWRPGNAPKTPRDGPFLLVANHTSLFDPVWIAWWLGRRSTFMASAALFQMPILSWVLPLCGSFPKTKFVKDRDSMRTMAERYEAGDIIVMFPEGTRSFDGQTREVLPGIGRVVKRLDARVVTARILTGHLFHPRWARYPRWVPVRLDYAPARTWSEDATVESINADITEAISLDLTTVDTGRFSFGFRMAEGLPDYLWACPTCFEQEGLYAKKNDVLCRACSARWTLNTNNRMSGVESMWVHEAHQRIEEHFGDVALSGALLLKKRVKRRWETLTSGPAELTEAGLKVGETLLEIEKIRGVSIELNGRLMFRYDGTQIEVFPERQSTLKWAHFMRRWLKGVR